MARVVLRYNIAHVRPWSKNGAQKTKTLSNEIELSFLFHSLRLDKQVILVYSFVKRG